MVATLNYAEATYLLASSVNQSMKGQLKLLLEERHLYQNVVSVDFSEILSEVSKSVVLTTHVQALYTFAKKLSEERIAPAEQDSSTVPNGSGAKPALRLELILQNVKLYCSTCKTRETFSPTWYKDATDGIMERHSRDHRIALPPPLFQMFVLAYQCETCKSAPVTFLIER